MSHSPPQGSSGKGSSDESGDPASGPLQRSNSHSLIASNGGYPADYYPGYQDQGEGIKEAVEWVLDFILRRKWVLLATVVAAVLVGAAYTYSLPPVYQARSLVLIDKGSGGSQQIPSYLSRGAGSEFARNDRSIQNELVILRNSQSLRRGVAERLLESGNAERLLEPRNLSRTDRLMQRLAGVVPGVFGSLATEEGSRTGKSESSSRTREASSTYSVNEVSAALPGAQFSPYGQGTSILQIRVTAGDPEVTASVANAYLEEYLELTQQASRAQISASHEFLKEQVQKRREELRSIEREIRDYKRRAGAVSLDQEGSSLVSKISQVETTRDETQVQLSMEQASLESLREQLKAIQPDQLSQRMSSGIEQEIEALQSRIAQLEVSKQQVLLEAGSPSPSDSAQVAQIDRRIQSLRQQVGSLSREYVDEIMQAGATNANEGVQRVRDLRRRIAEKRIEISGLEARIEILNDRIQEYEAELQQIPEKTMELAQLQRSLSNAEQMYQYTVKQLQETRIREESEVGYADGVTKASTPGAPIRPQHRRNLMLSLILGMLGGLGVALIRDQLDNRLYKPDRVGEMGYREVGLIPNLTPLIEEKLGGKDRVADQDADLESSLVCAVQPQSAAAEAYRSIRTNLMFGQSKKPVGALMVTSPGSGDGKSVTASNLAITMAQAGRTTLLIDADLRRPRIHEMFGIPQQPGCSDAVGGGLKNNITRFPIDDLWILPAGSPVDRPSEILGSSAFEKFLNQAQDYFDVVVIDTPPVLAATDASILSARCDATLCVVRAGTTTEAELDRAMETLHSVDANVIGTVFNGFDLSMAYGYKYRYRHYSRYGHYDQYHLPAHSE